VDPTEGESGPALKPPPAILRVEGQEQVSGIGSYCWSEPTGTDTAVSVCADTFGVITPEEPLQVSAPLVARFRLAPEGKPTELALRVLAVSPEDEHQPSGPGWRAWPGGKGEWYSLALEREPEIELDLTPGLYVLDLFARWQGPGNVSYGFLLEAQAGSVAAGLTVDEMRIVPANVDGPGHLEYADRLGEEVLARINGLRAHATERWLTHNQEALAPFGYRLESRFDAEWNDTFYDLFQEGEPEPLLVGLWHVGPVSVNASGMDFALAAENGPNQFALYLLVTDGGVEPWEAEESAFLPPVFVGDALARVTFTAFPTLTYQVELDEQPIFSGTASALRAYMPLRSFTAWDGHWALEVDDQVIVDGQDLGTERGYDAVYGFTLIANEPFYFFEQDGQVHMSYAGQTLPNVYDEVFHNQCCEAAIHNVESGGDAVWFHALFDGTWYFVEAGVYDGEMAGTHRYTAPEGWSFRYPVHWSRLDLEGGFVQDPATGRTVTFGSAPTSQAELEQWLEAEIGRKLDATEAENTLAEPLTVTEEKGLTAYRYAIRSRGDGSETLLRTTVFFDGARRYEFQAAIPPVAEEEYAAIVASFDPAVGN
jgi:hypothetical protein